MNRNTIGGIVIGGIITFICSYIFFHLSINKREPVYSIIKSPSIIFDKTNSSPKIKILIDDSLSISENIYVTTLAFWNKGKLPINKEDIRKNFFIYCSDSTSNILDYKILEQKDSSICNFKLIPVGKKLQIKWDYFDPQYGCKIQIIYSGVNKTMINISGNVLDTEVKQVSLNPLLARIFVFLLLGGLFGTFLTMLSMWYLDYGKSKKFTDFLKERMYVFYFTLAILVFILIYLFIMIRGGSIFLDKFPF